MYCNETCLNLDNIHDIRSEDILSVRTGEGNPIIVWAPISENSTILLFPLCRENGKETAVHKMNYENFIGIMAEMIKKYAGDKIK